MLPMSVLVHPHPSLQVVAAAVAIGARVLGKALGPGRGVGEC